MNTILSSGGGSYINVLATLALGLFVYTFMGKTARGTFGNFLKSVFGWFGAWLCDPIVKLFFTIKPIRLFFEFLIQRLTAGTIINFVCWTASKIPVKDPVKRALVHDADLVPLAQQHFPAYAYPEMWITNIPEDIERSPVMDGRLLNGEYPANVVADNAISRDNIVVAVKRSFFAGLFWFIAAVFLWNPNTYFVKWPLLAPYVANEIGNSVKAKTESNFDTLNGYPGAQRKQQTEQSVDLNVAKLTGDYWSAKSFSDAVTAAKKTQNEEANSPHYFAATTDSVINISKYYSASNGLLTSFAFGLCVFMGYFRHLVLYAKSYKVGGINVVTKDSVVRHAYRAEEREMVRASYLDQIKTTTTFDADTPLIELGEATGIFSFRGVLACLQPKQKFKYSLNDMSQHTLLLGGTGSGKTRNVIIPLFNQLLALRAKAIIKGDKSQISFYCSDGKAVLWNDIKAAAERAGQGDDVRIIGCNTRLGEYGLDLIDGVEPALVADIIYYIVSQATGGSGGDDFWPKMANEIIKYAAIIARAYEHTKAGLALVQQTGERIYSLSFIYTLIVNKPMMDAAIEAINNETAALENQNVEALAIANFLDSELTYAINQIRSDAWETLAPQTKTGIIANITKIMSPFATNRALRENFASGKKGRLMSISECWGNIVVVNLSSLEYGDAGRLINVFLKTLLYIEARKREMLDPKIGLKEKMFCIFDEFQDILSTSQAGMSDSTFWQVARSTGVVGFFATQSLSTLYQAFAPGATGKPVAGENFVTQCRNKIILNVEDETTVDYCIKLSGETLRGYVTEGRFESHEAAVKSLGYDPLNTLPVRMGDSREKYFQAIRESFWHFMGAAAALDKNTYVQNPFEIDFKLFGGDTTKNFDIGLHDSVTELGEQMGIGSGGYQSMIIRAEEKNQGFFESGNHLAPVLTVSDITNLGRGHAFVYIQRGGVARMDIMKLAA